MAFTGWPLKVDTWDDDMFLLVSKRLSCHRPRSTRHAASSQPLHDIDMDTYDYPIAETFVQRSDNIFLHVWAGPTPQVHYRFTDASRCAAWIGQSFCGISSSVPGWIRLGLPPMAARFAS